MIGRQLLGNGAGAFRSLAALRITTLKRTDKPQTRTESLFEAGPHGFLENKNKRTRELTHEPFFVCVCGGVLIKKNLEKLSNSAKDPVFTP